MKDHSPTEIQEYTFFYKQHFNKQRQAENDKTSSKC